MRFFVAFLVVLISCVVRAETLVTVAKILEITERGFVLTVGTEPLAVEDSAETNWWQSKSVAKRENFKVGDQVQVRIKTDSDPPLLKEMADVSTWKWLSSIRTESLKATIEKLDSKLLTVKFPDGSLFSYRITDKSEVKLASKTAATKSDLTAGMVVYVKGRLLPSLDTWVDEVSDTAPAAKPATTTSRPKAGSTSGAPKSPKPVKLPTSGKLEAVILADMPPLRMFDILVDGLRTYHITYSLETKYFLNGKATDRSALVKNAKCLVQYKRDQVGRLIASKVEVFTDNR